MMTKLVTGIILGGLVGYAVYRYVGCRDGACLLASSPWISTLYWMLIGALIGGSFRKPKEQPHDD